MARSLGQVLLLTLKREDPVSGGRVWLLLPPLSTYKSEIAAVCSLLLNSELYSVGKYSQ